MKILDRINRLPPDIAARVVEIVHEQNRNYVLKREVDPCINVRIQHVIRPTKTKEGREYWRGIQDKYHDVINHVSDQEYLIHMMEDKEDHYTSIDAISTTITQTCQRLQIDKRSRKRHVVALRNALWNYLYNTFDVSLELIGDSTNPVYPFNHSTVLHGITQHRNQLSINDYIAVTSEEKIKSLKITV